MISQRDWAVVAITIVVAVLIAVFAPAGRFPTILQLLVDSLQGASRQIIGLLAWACSYVYALGRQLLQVYHRAEEDTAMEAWYSQWTSSYHFRTPTATITTIAPTAVYTRLTALPIH